MPSYGLGTAQGIRRVRVADHGNTFQEGQEGGRREPEGVKQG